MTLCRGCGAVLQYDNPSAPGYTPKQGSAYCQRCFRLIHYDDLTVSMRTGIDPDSVLDRIRPMDALILWVVDLFDFEAGMIPGLARKLDGKDILLVCTKRDLLPETVSHEKVAQFVFRRLKEYGITVKELILASGKDSTGVQDIMEAVDRLAKERPTVVMGRANSGKSTLLNRMLGEAVLTSSRYPGTTLDFNEITINDRKFVDTPGIEIEGSILMCAEEADLRTILPAAAVKPQIFQIHGNQTFFIGGLARIDIRAGAKATAVFYISERLRLHRTKTEKADELWEKHYGELLQPVPAERAFAVQTVKKEFPKEDAVIDGLGWLCVSGDVSGITVHAPKGVSVTFRKAML